LGEPNPKAQTGGSMNKPQSTSAIENLNQDLVSSLLKQAFDCKDIRHKTYILALATAIENGDSINN
jgi:hypothetical protein